MGPFNLGDPVYWERRRADVIRKYVGVVVRVIPRGAVPDQDMFTQQDKPGGPRKDESYVVRSVTSGVAYWPRVPSLAPHKNLLGGN